MDNIQGTSGNDTFLGDNSVIQAADHIDGRGGTDKAMFTISAAGTMLNSKNVEQFFLQSVNDASTWNAINSMGVEQWWSNNSTHNLEVNNVSELAAVGVKGGLIGKNYTVKFNDSLLEGTADSLTIALDNASVANLTAGNATGAGVEEYNIIASGKNEVNDFKTSADTKTVTIEGSGNVKINTTIANATTINASKSTGNITVTSGVAKVNISTGDGNDKVTLGHATIDKDMVVSLGDGNDTLVIADGSGGISKDAKFNAGTGTDILNMRNGAALASRDVGKAFSNFEVFSVELGTGTYNLDHLRDNNTIEQLVVGKMALNASVTVSNLAKGADIIITESTQDTSNGHLTVSVKGADEAGSINDVLDITIGGKANVAAQTITAAHIETVNIESISTKAGGNTDNSIAVLTAANAHTLNLSGAEQLTITAFTGSTAISKIDASGMTDKFIMGAADLSTTATLLIGGTAADTLRANDAAGTVVVGGDGADLITLGATAANIQTIKYVSQADSTATAFDSITNYSSGANRDLIDIKFAGITNAVLQTVSATTKANVTGANSAATAAFEISAANAASFFTNSGVQTGVVFATDAATPANGAFVFVDVNADGQWDAATDLVIHLIGDFTGGNALTAANFVFA